MNWNNTRHIYLSISIIYTLLLDIWGYIQTSKVIAVSNVDFFFFPLFFFEAIQIIHCGGEGGKSIQQWNYTQTFVQKTIDNNYLIALERIQQYRDS